MADQGKSFDPRGFVQRVMRDCNFGELTAETRQKLEDSIQRRLAERIMATVIDNFTEREFIILKQVAGEHPELQDLELILLVSGEVPNLQPKLEKAVMDLYEEMTYDSRKLDEAREKGKKLQEAREAQEKAKTV